MTNEEKFRHHLSRAERQQELIEKFEDRVLETFKADTSRNVGQGAWVDARKYLEQDQTYLGMVGRRTAYQAQAQLYGLGAILDALEAGNRILPQNPSLPRNQ